MLDVFLMLAGQSGKQVLLLWGFSMLRTYLLVYIKTRFWVMIDAEVMHLDYSAEMCWGKRPVSFWNSESVSAVCLGFFTPVNPYKLPQYKIIKKIRKRCSLYRKSFWSGYFGKPNRLTVKLNMQLIDDCSGFFFSR